MASICPKIITKIYFNTIFQDAYPVRLDGIKTREEENLTLGHLLRQG
jgi:hypothetical protein